RYQDFKLVMIEGGVSWLPSLLRRMDENFRGVRREVPWCKRTPSEYFHEHVVVATQPFDLDGSDGLVAEFEQLGLPDRLVFASDYPHWDYDAPGTTAAIMPKHWRERVFRTNAENFYGSRAFAHAS